MTKANLKRLEEGKLYYSISEVCAMTGLEQHVLRYWESEFPQLRPKKNRSGNRAYRTKEIKIVRYIKYLLYEEMYTIPGAKKKMADMNMADLDGQLTLLRVPANPPAPKESGKPFQPAGESPGPLPGTGEAGREMSAAAGPEADDAGTAIGEAAIREATPGEAVRAENGSMGGPSVREEEYARDGGEPAARLRAELRRVKKELQDLLGALAAQGKGSA
jgi:DNA-binding transcriptional MerR regulator